MEFIDILIKVLPNFLGDALRASVDIIVKATPGVGGLGAPMIHMAGTAFFIVMSWWFFDEHTRG